MKVRILPFLTTFTQLTARLKNFLRGWLLVLRLKEGLVECATVCVKSEVILIMIHTYIYAKFLGGEICKVAGWGITENGELIKKSKKITGIF